MEVLKRMTTFFSTPGEHITNVISATCMGQLCTTASQPQILDIGIAEIGYGLDAMYTDKLHKEEQQYAQLRQKDGFHAQYTWHTRHKFQTIYRSTEIDWDLLVSQEKPQEDWIP